MHLNGKEFTKSSTKPALSLVEHSLEHKPPKCHKYVGESLQCLFYSTSSFDNVYWFALGGRSCRAAQCAQQFGVAFRQLLPREGRNTRIVCQSRKNRSSKARQSPRCPLLCICKAKMIHFYLCMHTLSLLALFARWNKPFPKSKPFSADHREAVADVFRGSGVRNERTRASSSRTNKEKEMITMLNAVVTPSRLNLYSAC